jgi:hypothetical protein
MSYECENTLTVSHGDPQVIKRIVKAYQGKRLFEEFIPCPKDLLENPSPMRNKRTARRFKEKYGAECWRMWRDLNWGTHKDTGRYEWNTLNKVSSTTIKLNIVTAFSPPVHVLALLWQIYSRCFFSLMQDRQYGHR